MSFYHVFFFSKAKRSRKARDKGYVGVIVEIINQIVDRADRNDSIKMYCDNSNIFKN